MPVLIPTPQAHAADVHPLWEIDKIAIAQGLEGQQVREQIAGVSHHWCQQSVGAVAEFGVKLLDELNNYRHVPFERVGTRRVRYVRIKDLQPRVIDVDEEEE